MTPQSEAELSQMVTSAASAGQVLRIMGGGTRQSLGNPVAFDKTLNTTALTGISLYEPGALTLVAKAGTPVDEITNLLDSEGQQLAFEPPDYRALLNSQGSPTIGGVVACNISGPRRIQAGACRDALIGVRYVNGEGEIVKNGGRVMKNVTGYDLVKLLAGSYGTLGVLSEVAFKLLPKAQTTSSVVLRMNNVRTAVEAMSAALGSPFDVTGAVCVPDAGSSGQCDVAIRIEGFETSVTYRAQKLQQLLGQFGEAEIATDDQRRWQEYRDVKPLHGVAGDLWRISVRPSDAANTIKALDENGVTGSYLLDWGGGLIWAVVPVGTQLRGIIGPVGHASLLRGENQPAFHPQSARIEQISAGLRKKFDPQAILNRGIMG